jgi:uncharacterized integral membrane protein
MKKLKNIVAALLLLIAIIVVFQNREMVDTKFLFATLSMPRALLLLLTLAVGVVLGLLLGTKLPGFPKGKK